MLKRDVTYENLFDGTKTTETFYFNLTQAETIEFGVSYKEGLAEAMTRMVRTRDMQELVSLVKKLILISFGERSEDGKYFLKDPERRDLFAQSMAYDALFMELATNDESVMEFIMGVFPKDLTKNITPAAIEQAASSAAKE